MSKKDKKKTTQEQVNPEEEIREETQEAATEDTKEAEDAAQSAANAGGKEETSDARDSELANLKDKYVRQVAEFDNFRKRTEKEKAAMYDIGAMAILEKILPTIDNFERGLKDAPEDDAFAEGIKKIYKELMKNLEAAGVTPIEALGQEFDPNIHNAVMHEEDDSGEENVVSEELQKGYRYKDHILRHSMVKVKN